MIWRLYLLVEKARREKYERCRKGLERHRCSTSFNKFKIPLGFIFFNSHFHAKCEVKGKGTSHSSTETAKHHHISNLIEITVLIRPEKMASRNFSHYLSLCLMLATSEGSHCHFPTRKPHLQSKKLPSSVLASVDFLSLTRSKTRRNVRNNTLIALTGAVEMKMVLE